jgi:hypothetical protein
LAWQPFGQTNRGGIGQYAHKYLRQEKLSLRHRDNQITGQGKFKSPADRQPVDGSNHRLVQIVQFGDAGKATATEVTVEFLTFGCSLQVSAGGDELLPTAGNNRHPKGWIVAKLTKQFTILRLVVESITLAFGRSRITSRICPLRITF